MKQSRRIEKAFLELVKCGIWGNQPDSSLFEQCTQCDWIEIYKMAGKQTVLGICLQSILKLPETDRPQATLLLQWVGASRYIEANMLKKLAVWKELDQQWTEAGYRPVVFKGLSVAQWYANPMSRQFSDIDVYIPERFKELIKTLKSSGIECKHKPQHETIEYKGVSIEIHPSIINVPCKPKIKSEIIEERINDEMVIRIPDLNTYSLILLSHAGGHFLVPGIGYRFLCDWAVFLKKNHANIDTDLVLREVKRMGMQRFAAEFTRLAEVKLGLHFDGIEKWTEGWDETYTRKLSRSLFTNGDFGAVNFKQKKKQNPIKESWDTYKNLKACKYYWPKLYWKVAPGYQIKHSILLILKYFHFRV